MVNRKLAVAGTIGVQRGMTLIEVMVTLVIVAIIAAIAVPSYQSSVVKSNRGVGKAELMQLVARQEQYFVNNKIYATDLTKLGYPANGFYINRGGEAGTSGEGAVYKIELAGGATTSSFTAQATPIGVQIKDTSCNTLTISDTGERSATGSNGSACWH